MSGRSWLLRRGGCGEMVEERDGARVGVIVPGLAEERAGIDRVFREVLAAELEDIGAAEDGGPYEFSLGVALAKKPMVTVAMDVMRWVSWGIAVGASERAAGVAVLRWRGGGAGGASGVRCV